MDLLDYKEPLLLPMPLDEYHYLLTAKKYEYPPTKKDGGRKAILIRDILHPLTGELLGGYRKGREGVVIPLNQHCMQRHFIDHKEWMLKGPSSWNKGNERLLDQVYDFFIYTVGHRSGKYGLSSWHAYISRFDFEYIK